MSDQPSTRVLVLNSGSSSLKAAVYEIGSTEVCRISIEAGRIGAGDGRGQGHLRVRDERGVCLLDESRDLPDHHAALGPVLEWVRRGDAKSRPDVVGHRIVHGGSRFREPMVVTRELLAALASLTPMDPGHLPPALEGVRAVERAYPGIRQVACFDTGFHRDMPWVARAYPLPPRVLGDEVFRYGFHGLSYEYVMGELRAQAGDAARGRVVIAHLGNGASMAAIRDGRCVDTTMGFTPAGGLMMGTRSGDLDPGLLIYLQEQRGLAVDDLRTLINRQSGLLGVSGISADMRDLLEQEVRDPRAARAVELFCYQARKWLAACVASLSGLDILVFTAGIGQHSATIRARICAGLEFLGIELDAARNARHESLISTDASRAMVRVIRTNEELMVARHASQLAR